MIDLNGAKVLWTSAADGDLGRNSSEAERLAFHRRPWLQLNQVHGANVVVAEDLTQTLVEADASVTRRTGLTLAIGTADCAPLALASKEGIIGAVHAGWRGLSAGVVERTVETMRGLGATDIRAALGPCIHGECYEFDSDTVEQLSQRWGSEVRASTTTGTIGLDMVAAISAVCRSSGVELDYVAAECTACDTSYFSHRARQDKGRQVMLLWRDA